MAKIIVQPGQSLFDIAVKYYGSVEGVFDILRRNKLKGITDNVYAGDELELADRALNTRVARFLEPYEVATMEERLRADGIGWMQLGSASTQEGARSLFCVAEPPPPALVTLRADVSASTQEVRLAEGSEVGLFVRLSRPAVKPVSLPIQVVEAGGASLADYSLRDASGVSIKLSKGRFSITFEAEQDTQYFSVIATEDALAETGEGIILALSDLPPGYLSGTEHTVTLPFTSSEDKELIAVDSLEKLDAIRYDLDGNGIPATAGRTAYLAAFGNLFTSLRRYGGYRLTTDLDFAGTKWEDPTGGTFVGTRVTGGWTLIGDITTVFSATFDGNGHVISNLYISRTDRNIGFFGFTSRASEIRNLRLENASVASNSSQSFARAGTLVGFNKGTITSCYSTGSVSGGTGRNFSTGGLVGDNEGAISLCYSSVMVFGASISISRRSAYTGGLVGNNFGTIENCYSASDVAGRTTHDSIGGLMGYNEGTISSCYAAGAVSTGSTLATAITGGLFASEDEGTVTDSYFDTETSGVASGTGAQATAALQSPTSATGIYGSWDAAIWGFGTSSEYPVLRVDFDRDGSKDDDIARQRQT